MAERAPRHRPSPAGSTTGRATKKGLRAHLGGRGRGPSGVGGVEIFDLYRRGQAGEIIGTTPVFAIGDREFLALERAREHNRFDPLRAALARAFIRDTWPP